MDGLGSFAVYEKNLQERKKDAWANLKDSEDRLKRDQAAYNLVLQEEESFNAEVKSRLWQDVL